MRFYSTNNSDVKVDLQEAVLQGLAPDGGLFMPEAINPLPTSFINNLDRLSFVEIATGITKHLLGNDLLAGDLEKIVEHTIQFDAPLVEIEKDIYALELYHGPTLAFKDFGARFLSGLLGHFARQQNKEIVILAATSGDTGSAVANGFLNVPGTRVVVLYPSGKVSDVQERQFTTLGGNITALEVSGTFDDCQRLVKSAFLDPSLKSKLTLASANSINIGRLIPQTFYYFEAYARLAHTKPVVFSVPSGNFGNLTAGLFAKRLGLPVHKFIAATNINDIVPTYLKTGIFTPRSSADTISNAMDVGSPSNFARLIDLCNADLPELQKDVVGYSFTDIETKEAIRKMFALEYLADPHGAVGYLGIQAYLKDNPQDVTAVFLETAHPGKFKDVVEETIDKKLDFPERLRSFMKAEKKSVKMSREYEEFRSVLMGMSSSPALLQNWRRGELPL